MDSQNTSDLTDFISSVVGEAPLRVEESYGDGFVRLRTSEAERRQAKHDIRCIEDVVIELLRNARDAGAHNIYLATAREGDRRLLVCADDGSGIPEHMHERVFEPRVTSKLDSMQMDQWGVHGRGMALYSIRQNTNAISICASKPGFGTAIAVHANPEVLAERADQSTWPHVETAPDGRASVTSGPHNIIRTVTEFAFNARPSVTVYFGSPAEVLATMVAHGDSYILSHGLDLTEMLEALPIPLRPSCAGDAKALVEQAKALGIEVSERTAYRILNGEIKQLKPVHLEAIPKHRPSSPVDLAKDQRGLKVSPADLESFSRDLTDAFKRLGEGYYLSLSGTPRIRVAKNKISVVFDIAKED